MSLAEVFKEEVVAPKVAVLSHFCDDCGAYGVLLADNSLSCLCGEDVAAEKAVTR